MLARQTRLIALLNQELEKHKSLVEKYKSSLKSSVVNKNLLESLKEDQSNISHESEETLSNIIENFDINPVEKILLKNNIVIVKNIIQMNKTLSTTIELEDNQLKSLERFIKYLEEENLKSETSIPLDEPEYEDALSRIKEINEILEQLNDRYNTKIITNISLIKEILTKSVADEKQKRKILISLMKYNKEISLKTKKSKILKEYLGELLDENEVSEIFKKYGYDFSLLTKKVKDSILQYGDLKNINEVLDCLNGFKYPKLDEKKDANTIFALVVASTFETINNCTIHATNKGFKKEDLLQIPSALVKQSRTKTIFRKLKTKDESTVSIDLEKLISNPNFLNEQELAFDLLNGKSIDFITNIEYLDDNGFDLMYIFNKCKHLLVLDSNRLITNLSIYEKYCLPLDCTRDKLTNQTFSALLGTNIAEIADQFIEVHPLGYKYITDNLSCLKEYTNPHDLVFNNIYESQKPIILPNGQPIIENAFKEIKNNHTTTIQLCDEITRRTVQYLKTPYRNITEENKVQKTNTYIPTFKNDEEMRLIIKNNYCDIYDDIFENKYIKKIEKYTDKSNPLIYNFDGIRISKLKVLRIFGILLKKNVPESKESFAFSITYNSILSERAYSKINSILIKELGEE